LNSISVVAFDIKKSENHRRKIVNLSLGVLSTCLTQEQRTEFISLEGIDNLLSLWLGREIGCSLQTSEYEKSCSH
jgi:hypothetical protein